MTKNETIKEDTNTFVFTEDQQKVVAEHFGLDFEKTEYFVLCEKLDEIIDRLA